MNVIAHLFTSLARRLRCEQAIAMPVTVMILSVMALLGVAAAASAISATRVSGRDRSAARALAAADAGIDTTRGRLNVHNFGAEEGKCVFRNTDGELEGGDIPVAGGWCDADDDSLDDGVGVELQMSDARTIGLHNQRIYSERDVVSTGSAGGVDRRVFSTIRTPLLTEWFARYTVIGVDGIDLRRASNIDAGGVPYTGDDAILGAVSNQHIKLWDNADLDHVATLPASKSVWMETGPPANTRDVTEPDTVGTLPELVADRKTLMEVEVEVNPGEWERKNSWINDYNDNGPYVANVHPLEYPFAVGDPCMVVVKPITCTWDPDTRKLVLHSSNDNPAILNFGPGSFSFCDVDITGLARIAIHRQLGDPPTKFFIDSPEQCERETGTKPDGNYDIDLDVAGVHPDQVPGIQFIVAGSEVGDATTLNLRGSGIGTIYAPKTAVTLESFRLNGAVAGKTVVMKGASGCSGDLNCSSSVTTHEGIPDVARVETKLFASRSWAECTAVPPTSVPDSGC